MQKRKFDELISHFNRKVSDMSIDQKYKMELLGMISAIGFAHENELSTNLAEVGTDCISREQAIDVVEFECGEWSGLAKTIAEEIKQLPSAEPERVWHPVEKPPAHHKDVIVRGVEAIGNVTVHKVMQWDVDTWRPTNYAPSIMWTEWSEI